MICLSSHCEFGLLLVLSKRLVKPVDIKAYAVVGVITLKALLLILLLASAEHIKHEVVYLGIRDW
jgi:inner membrane protein involved in colicin E2 resistance